MPVSIVARSVEISPPRRDGFACSRVSVPLRDGVVAVKAPPGFKGTRMLSSPRSMRHDGASAAMLIDARSRNKAGGARRTHLLAVIGAAPLCSDSLIEEKSV